MPSRLRAAPVSVSAADSDTPGSSGLSDCAPTDFSRVSSAELLVSGRRAAIRVPGTPLPVTEVAASRVTNTCPGTTPWRWGGGGVGAAALPSGDRAGAGRSVEGFAEEAVEVVEVVEPDASGAAGAENA